MNKKILIGVVLTVLVLTVAAAVLLLSGPRMRTQPSLRTFETTMPLPPGNAEFYLREPFSAEKIEMPRATEQTLNEGKTYYGYYCVFCHGEDGKGNGPVGHSYMPRPADLSTDSIKRYSPAELYRRSFTGIGHEPVMERVVPAEFRKYILFYIRNGIEK